MSVRTASTLIVGIVLIGAGALFLVANLTEFDVNWVFVLKILLPGLFILAGSFKLVRHFTWPEEQIVERPGKSGLLGGLFWLSFGVVILLDILGVLETLPFIGLFWPVIFILFGLGKIVDYYRLGGRMQLRTAEVFGIVFIVVFGWSCGRLAKAHLPLMEDWNLGLPWPVEIGLDDEKFSFESVESFEAENIESLEVTNLYGDVSVEPSDSKLVKITLSKIVREENRSLAESLASEVEIVVVPEDAALKIETSRPKLGDRGRKLTTNLRIEAPASLVLSVINKFGAVRIEDWETNCKVESSYGPVQVESVIGEVEISNKYRSVELRQIKGNVTVKNRRGRVSVEDVEGDVTAETDHQTLRCVEVQGGVNATNHFGRIDLRKISGAVVADGPGSRVEIYEVEGPVGLKSSHKGVTIRELSSTLDLETSYSNVSLEDLGGFVELKAVHADVSAERIQAGIKIQGKGSRIVLSGIQGELGVETSLRMVTIEKFSGPVSMQNEYGEIQLQAPADLVHPVTARNKNGAISLIVPPGADFNLSAQAVEGEIQSDFGPKPEESEGNVAYLQTIVGEGGPKIELQTTYSRIRIQKRG